MKDFLLRFVSDPNFSPDLIIFDLESLKDPHVKIFETSRLISNLAMLGRNRKPPVLGVFVFEDSSPELIRDVMDTDIKGIVPVIEWMGMPKHCEAICSLLAGKVYMPKELLQHFKILKPISRVRPSKHNTAEDLTPRQKQVLHLISERGISNKNIARTLKITESTVKLHIGKILKKYGVSNRTQLALLAKKPEYTV